MKVILLCAGYATRLYPLTENQPKPLLPIAGRPILEYILDRVKEVPAVDQVIAVTNDKFAGHFEDWGKGLDYPWTVETVNDKTLSNDDRLGAIGDLQYAIQEKGIGVDEDILVVAGDNLFDFDLKSFISFAEEKRPAALIATYDVQDIELAKKYGLVELDDNQQVVQFFEKPENPPTTLASCGIYWLPKETRELLDRYLREGHNPDQPGHYMRWLADQSVLYGMPLVGEWYDIGDLNSYQEADQKKQTK